MARTRDEVAKDCQLAERIYMSAKDKALYAEAFEKECLGHLISLENELEEIDTEAGAYARPDPATPLSRAEADVVVLLTDFDAALDGLECDQMNLDQCHDEWNKSLVDYEDEVEAQLCEAGVKIATSLRDASRQRVRELYEAVVRDG